MTRNPNINHFERHVSDLNLQPGVRSCGSDYLNQTPGFHMCICYLWGNGCLEIPICPHDSMDVDDGDDYL